MRVLHVASEFYPLVKTGGLADVVGALPGALLGIGVDARLLLPGYPRILDGLSGIRVVGELPNPWGGAPARLLVGRTAEGVACYAVDSPRLYDRPGNPYLDPQGRDWADNHRRFALLGWAAAWLAGEGGGWRWRPDIVHAHDWQAGLAPAYIGLRQWPRPATVSTIHNIAYQGVFPPTVLNELAIPPEAYSIDGLEYHGQIGFLKAALWYADRITTVSPTYALEIQTPEGGMGMEGLLQGRAGDLSGILNGVDYGVWSPATDARLPARYTAEDMAGKAACKAALQAEFALDADPAAPLFGVISRLTQQKGFDLLLHAAPRLLAQGAQLAVLGSGEAALEEGFQALAQRHPGQVGTFIGYDEALSHRVQGGADVIVMPSRSEPCGLVQMYALKYGSLPLVRRTGGLADTVVHAAPGMLGAATGFVFDDADVQGLSWGFAAALELYRDPEAWRRVQRNAMAQDFSWTASARHYRDLYRDLFPDV
ncbi:glycogen synthase GlgA [Arenibaculum pallidiluteum]|uniref:glycogen synthase GlgA n=1 Tax=Arenibaculum pallidiluteum TaxID=2812559 RepID=UPI001A96A364|nr:glycogen synthase GlgA [Arenibaculum pallidiluteum]